MRELTFDELGSVAGGLKFGDITFTIIGSWVAAVGGVAVGTALEGTAVGGVVGGAVGFLLGVGIGVGYILTQPDTPSAPTASVDVSIYNGTGWIPIGVTNTTDFNAAGFQSVTGGSAISDTLAFSACDMAYDS